MCRWTGSRVGSPSMRTRPRSGESGFTLLEVFAFAVLAVLVGILQVFGGGLGTTESARAYTTAALLARSKLAEVRAGDAVGRRTTGKFRCGLSLAPVGRSGYIAGNTAGPSGVRRLIGAGAAERTKNRQRRREASGFGQGRRGERRGQHRPELVESPAVRQVSGLLADDLILIKSRSPSSGPTSAATALTLSTLRLGRQPNNLGTRVR